MRLLRVYSALKLLLAALLCTGTIAAQQPFTVTLDGASPTQTFEGLGALSAGASSRLLIDYPEPQRSQILDYLFRPKYGASLQHLKVEVGADVNSTDGAEPSHMRSRTDHDYTRGYEWWLIEEAKKRNPKIILDILPWGAPGWVGGGKLYSQDMADYMADFIEGAWKVHHLRIQYSGIWNERNHDDAYIKMLHGTFAAHHLSTKIVCCDEVYSRKHSQWTIADEMRVDPALKADVDVIGVHYPHDQKTGAVSTSEAARISGKPLWSSEDQPNPGEGPYITREWNAGGRILAHRYNANFIDGHFTKTEIWSPVTSYYDILAAPNSGLMYANTPWSGNYDVQSTIWVTAHTTQFAQPGWKYLDTSSGNLPGKGTYVTLTSPAGDAWSVVLETVDATSPQRVAFTLRHGLRAKTVHLWETNTSRTFEHVSDIAVKDGTFTYTFDPDSLYTLTTTTGQHRGDAVPPPAKPFPMPYRDSFDEVMWNRAPKYLSDQDGAFEVHTCAGRAGRCLEQVITQKPIPWSPIPDPFTIAGSVVAKDYDVAADFHLQTGNVALLGRIDSSDVFRDKKALFPSGYILSLNADGSWKLMTAVYKKPTATLASGKTGAAEDTWHHVVLSFRGITITATLDGKELANVQDTSHVAGMFGLGTGWNTAQFYNLAVTPAP